MKKAEIHHSLFASWISSCKMHWALCIIFFTFSIGVYGQEMWGIANSNYAGNMGMHLNPASMVGAPYKYEINLVAGDFFFDNNYLNWNNFSDMLSSHGVVHDNYTAASTKHAYMS